MPSADCNSDHRLLLVKFQIKVLKARNRIIPKNLTVENENAFEGKLSTVIDGLPPININSETVESIWLETKDIISSTIRQMPTTHQPKKHQHWMSDETLEVINNRRILRNSGLNSQEAKS